MDILTLTRTERSENGTFGTIRHGESIVAVTCERPENNNKPMSCVPCGTYKTDKFNSPSKGEVFLLRNVPGRSMIEIHVGNTVLDTDGCILVGTVFGVISGVQAVLNSRKALDLMLSLYPAGFILDIVED